MLNSIVSDSFSITTFLICIFTSLILGAILAWLHCRFNNSSKGFVITIALLPAIVQMVILLVNGNLGTGLAVMGAFSLVRFRSIPGSAKEISSIFMSMAIGLATGTGYIAVAGLFTLVIGATLFLYYSTGFGEPKDMVKELKITVPEGVDYTAAFVDLFQEYTSKCELLRVKTSNMGSLYKLQYHIQFKSGISEKEFLDHLRCRNSNLEITCGKISYMNEEL